MHWLPAGSIANGKALSLKADDYGPDVVCNFMLDFITRHKNSPFLFYYPMILTHGPYVPTSDSKSGAKRNFVDMVYYTDKLVARIVAYLKKLGLFENTVILFTGDNGTGGTISSTLEGRAYKGGKGKMNLHGTHVPLVASWPAGGAKGALTNVPIDFTAFFPTLMDLARATPPANVKLDGASFAPTHRLFVSTIDQFPGKGPADRAVAAVERAVAMDFEKLVQTHRRWWKDYYPASFISVPFAEMESFYWIQIYKLGSTIRKGGPICDLMGPWYVKSRWPACWWNMNTQVLYWPFPAANRLGMAENLSDSLHRNMSDLIANVPKEWRHDSAGISRATGQGLSNKFDSSGEKANLVWACHNLWVQYRCTMDDTFLTEQLYQSSPVC